jgi:hypothetical protein
MVSFHAASYRPRGDYKSRRLSHDLWSGNWPMVCAYDIYTYLTFVTIQHHQQDVPESVDILDVQSYWTVNEVTT